jgi:hypothetical protein
MIQSGDDDWIRGSIGLRIEAQTHRRGVIYNIHSYNEVDRQKAFFWRAPPRQKKIFLCALRASVVKNLS